MPSQPATISCEDFDFTVKQAGATLSLADKTMVSFLPAKCSKFSEESALLEKIKPHLAADSRSGQIELSEVLPFGCEYDIKRRFDFGSSFVRVTVDFDPGAGKLDFLELDPVNFPAKWTKLCLFTLTSAEVSIQEFTPESAPKSLYASPVPPLAIQLEYADGTIIEWGCGNQIWHYQTGELVDGCTPFYELKRTGDGVDLVLTPVKYSAPEKVLARRSWRFEYYLAYGKLGRDNSQPGTEVKLKESSLPNHVLNLKSRPCYCAAPVRRTLREVLRRTDSDVKITDCAPELCNDAAHLERPNKKTLLHWDIEEYMELHSWGNKLLGKTGKRLTFSPLENHWSNRLLVSTLIGRDPANLQLT